LILNWVLPLSPVPRQTAPVQVEPSGHFVRVRIGLTHTPPQFPPQLLAEPLLAIRVVARSSERRLDEARRQIEVRGHLGEVRTHRRVRAEMGEEHSVRPPLADAAEALAEEIEIDVGRR